jgi:hypothetical protein
MQCGLVGRVDLMLGHRGYDPSSSSDCLSRSK